MKLIVGLGNPESDYSKTRHNMGFNVLNKLAKDLNVTIERKKFNGLYESVVYNGEKIILLKPQTFMNLSGECIKQFVDFYKIEVQDLCVIYDDIDLGPGDIRIRKKGSGGSHNGMKSVIHFLDSIDFPRIRVGIGKPVNSDLINYVIGFVPEDELKKLDVGVTKAKDAVMEYLKNGIDSAMNKFN